MSLICELCEQTFNSKKSLNIHKKNAKFCREYTNIRFYCTNCSYNTLSINKIDIHVKNCTEKSKSKRNISEEIEEITKKYNILLEIEKAKNEVWRSLLECNTNIKTSTIIEHEKNVVNFYPVDGINIDVIVHKNITSQQETKKYNYRKFKGDFNEQTNNSDNEEIIKSTNEESKIESIDPDNILDSKVDNTEDNDTDNINFDDIINKLKNTKIYTKIIDEIKKKRTLVFKNMILEDYIKMILDHNKSIKDIFINKNYTEKKINNILSKSLTSLESRLIFNNSHIESHIDMDELNTLMYVIRKKIDDNKVYIPYKEDTLYNKFYNYGIVVFPIEKLLDIFLFNKYGYNNIIYVPLKKSTNNDPYSFYVLDKINNGKKYWRMDCRLEDLLTCLSNNLLSYMIGTFRILYKLVFDDNDFRKDYMYRCQLTDGDCEQLLINIILISKTNVFHKILKEKIRTISTYKLTDNDKINLQGDDPLQRKRLQEKDNSDIVDVLKQLFDDISTEETVDFYRDFSNRSKQILPNINDDE